MSMMAPLSAFCEECGAANALSATHCFACKEPLVQSAPAPIAQPFSPSPPAAVPSSMVSSQVATTRGLAPMVTPGPGVLLKQRYKIVREIGQGGFGVVYLAEDWDRKHKLVAIKQINIGKLNVRESIDATDSYNREVALLPKLRHKRLPRFHDHFTDPAHWYLVLDYIEGQTLEEYVQTQPEKSLPLKQVLKIGVQACDVLHYLHTQNPPVIFRDVKPANLMYTRKGKLYLIDFGIARRFVPGKRKDTGPLGSPGYAAPEQYGLTQTSQHTDIYGLGATLQTLLTGKEPLDPPASNQPPARQQRRYRRLLRLLDQMQEKDGRKRPKNIQHVMARLEYIQHGRLLPYLRGLLLGLSPFLLINAMHFLNYSNPYLYLNPIFSIIYSITSTLYCLWPFLFLAQIVAAFVMFFQPRKRYVSLGLFTAMALLILLLLIQPSLIFFGSPGWIYSYNS